MPYLKSDEVFSPNNYRKSYIVLSDIMFNVLKSEEFDRFIGTLDFVREKTYHGEHLGWTVKIYQPKNDVFYRGGKLSNKIH